MHWCMFCYSLLVAYRTLKLCMFVPVTPAHANKKVNNEACISKASWTGKVKRWPHPKHFINSVKPTQSVIKGHGGGKGGFEMTNSAADRGTHTQKKRQNTKINHMRGGEMKRKKEIARKHRIIISTGYLRVQSFRAGILVQLCGKQEVSRKEEVVLLW